MEEVYDFFSKQYQFSTGCAWTLPNTNSMFVSEKWQVPVLQDKKGRLNAVKSKLNNYPLEKWHRHTSRMNPSGSVIGKVRRDFDIDFITQAWCKFYETISTYDVIPECTKELRKFNSVHLCEAPGGFVAALNHFLVSKAPEIKWKWMATSLNPHYEGNDQDCTIVDDRVILSTYPFWTFGADHTGDLMKIENLRDIENEVIRRGLNETGTLLLVTADGSIDCQNNPGEQENVVSDLLFCEAVTALHILDTGGSLVLKAFTVFECNTICLFYILVCSFRTVLVWKPATSREGNSEMYVVCLHYIGKTAIQPWLDVLRQNYGNRNEATSIFPQNAIPERFMDEIIQCSEKFLEFQVQAIEKNISTYTEEDVHRLEGRGYLPDQCDSNALRKAVAAEFISGYEVEAIPKNLQILQFEDKITQGKSLKWLNNLYSEQSDVTFTSKKKEQTLKETLLYLRTAFQNSNIVRYCFHFDYSSLISHAQNDFLAIFCEVNPYIIQENQDVILGKRIDKVKISKFCHSWYLDMLEQIQSLYELIKQSRNAHIASEGVSEGNESMTSTSSGNVAEGNEPVPSTSAHSILNTNCGESPSTVIQDCYFSTSFKGSENSENNGCPYILVQENMFKLAELTACIRNRDYQILHWSTNRDSGFLLEMICVFHSVEVNENILIVNPFPVFTQFEVGLLYLFGLLFRQVYFIWSFPDDPNGNYGILFSGRHVIMPYQIDVLDYLSKILRISEEQEDENTGKEIISVVPLKRILEADKFYGSIMCLNHMFLEKMCKELLENCEVELALCGHGF